MKATTTILLIILSLLASGKAWSQGEGSYSYSETASAKVRQKAIHLPSGEGIKGCVTCKHINYQLACI
ncbi:MAG: hypothetical protein PHC95_14805 [Parabacteroides sp.]|nr:hypothetical protein [Parabacteroides sp.]